MSLLSRVFWMSFAVLALSVTVAFADTAPGPSPPAVMVHMVSNGNPDASVSEITYHCMGDPTEDTGAVTQRAMALSCSGGNCTNEGSWFYKLNPCFVFPGGYFTYDYGGSQVQSDDFNFSGNYTNYELTIDAPSGNVSSSSGTSGCCASAFILAVIGAGAAFYRRR